MSKRVGVMIPHPEVWEEFRKFVEKKWGRKYSTMGVELEIALKKYMRDEMEYEHTRTHTHEPKIHKSKTKKVTKEKKKEKKENNKRKKRKKKREY